MKIQATAFLHKVKFIANWKFWWEILKLKISINSITKISYSVKSTFSMTEFWVSVSWWPTFASTSRKIVTYDIFFCFLEYTTTISQYWRNPSRESITQLLQNSQLFHLQEPTPNFSSLLCTPFYTDQSQHSSRTDILLKLYSRFNFPHSIHNLSIVLSQK